MTEPERDGVASTYTGAYQWRQTISFDECIHDDSLHAASATQQLSVDSIFVLYNRDEQILRYAMSNSIGPISGMYEFKVFVTTVIESMFLYSFSLH